MQFEEAWYFLGLIGFKKLGWDYYLVSGKGLRSRKHQIREARENVERLFSDKHIFKPSGDWSYEDNSGWRLQWVSYHEPEKPKRDKTIPVPGPKKCKRCSRKKHLERDHIIALVHGGKDISSNLQWLCAACHDLKHARENVIEKLNSLEKGHWRKEMWAYRLKALDRLNPIGEPQFHSYWEDPKTHYEAWYQGPLPKADQNLKLESFIEG